MEKRPKRSHVKNVETIDRLSHLPNHILHHILSFLDTKRTVQTSVLSKRWRCLWKDVHVLRFKRDLFPSKSRFIKHVKNFFSRRFDSAMVYSIDIDLRHDLLISLMDKDGLQLSESVLSYAAEAAASSINGGGLHHLSISRTQPLIIADCYDILRCITTCGLHESLETLELMGCYVMAKSFADFNMLTSLELTECCFCSSGGQTTTTIDPFTNLPRLSRLKLLDCGTSDGSSFKVTGGSQLLELEIRVPRDMIAFKMIEVSAPNLKSLVFRAGRMDLKENLKLNLPSLDYAVVQLCWSDLDTYFTPDPNDEMQRQSRSYMNMLRGLRNAKSLVLHFSKERWKKEFSEVDHIPLTNMKSIMESEASPFTRLETLRVKYNNPVVPRIPYQVIRYFFEGSPNTGDKFVKFEEVWF